VSQQGNVSEKPANKRVGVLVPSSNTVMETDFYRRTPPGVTVHTGRMFMEETTAEAEERMLDEFATPAARALATARPDVVVFGCTSAGALRGNDYDGLLCERLSQLSAAPVVSVIASVRRAIGSRRGTRIGVITPYVDELNDKIRASLEADGVHVVGIHGLGITENFEIAEVPPDEIVEFGKRCFMGADIDLLFASCTNFRAVDARERLQEQVGVPVVTSNQVAFDATMAVLERGGVQQAQPA
jgi:maleate isomerase